MKEWEEVYDCLAELEEGYCFLLQEYEGYQSVTDVLLQKRRARLYALLAALEHRLNPEA